MSQRILLVEDEIFIRDLYRRQLEKAGYAVDAFPTGEEGLAAVLSNLYDLAVLDIMLPRMSGLDLLKKIKEAIPTQNLPVILLTNIGYEEVIKEGFRLGAEGYLIKSSYLPNQIVDEIKNLLQKKQAPSPEPTPDHS